MNIPENMTLQSMVQKSGSGTGSGEAKTTSLSDKFSWPGRVVILAAIVLSPWAFGSVQHWAQQWIMVCLLAGAAFWWFETALNKRKSQVFPTIFFLVAIGMVLGMLQTIPLPDVVSETVLGRQSAIYSDFSGESNVKASVSLDHEGTWDQIRLLMIAVLGLVLGCRYFRTKRDIVLLMTVVSANGVLISFFGIVHKFTTNGKMFWIHEVALGGMPFGPFVNRNNGAGYLLMCLACCIGLLPIVMVNRKKEGPGEAFGKDAPFLQRLGYRILGFIAELTATKLGLIFGIAMIVSGIVASLSRGGVVSMMVGGIGTLIVYGMARRPKNIGMVLVPFLLLVIALSGWIGFWDELGARFERIDVANVEEADSRIEHWKETWPAVVEMGWFGSGLGSYRGVHRLYRGSNEGSVFHYAENQYFQSLVEAGVIGLGLFLAAWVLAYQYASLAIYRGNSTTTIGVGTMGMFLIFSQSVASFFDFGLYITANLLLMSVLVGFLAFHGQSLAGRLKRRSWLRFELSNQFVQVIVLVLFAGGTMVALDLNRRATLDRMMVPRAADFEQRPLDAVAVEKKIAELKPLIQRTPTVASLNYAGELWLYRSRLAILDTMIHWPDFEATTSSMTEAERLSHIDDLWTLTGIERIHENAYFLRREGTLDEVKEFLNSPPIRENLPQAASCFYYSSRKSPLQPRVHLRLGEVKGVIGEPHEGDVDLERALRLAPGNANFQKTAGLYFLQSGNSEAAGRHFQRYLVLNPRGSSELIRIFKGRNYRNMVPVSDEFVLEEVLPDDPQILYQFATQYWNENDMAFGKCLEKAAEILVGQESNRWKEIVLLGDVQKAQGDLVGAVKQWKRALSIRPNTPKIRYNRAKLLVELGKLDEALAEAKYLQSRGASSSVYNKFLENVDARIRQRNSQ